MDPSPHSCPSIRTEQFTSRRSDVRKITCLLFFVEFRQPVHVSNNSYKDNIELKTQLRVSHLTVIGFQTE
jgi:hypothetical protein